MLITALCCGGTMCCNKLCLPCKKMGAERRNFYRLGFIIFALLWIMSAIFWLYFGGGFISYLGGDCPGVYGDEDELCLAMSIVYRISFSLASMHFIIAMICLCPSDFAKTLNEGAWPIKMVFCSVVFILTFVFGWDFLRGYFYVCLGAGVLFSIFEGYMLIHLAYTGNGVWLNMADNSQDAGTGKAWLVIYLLGTFLLYAGCITLLVFFFIWHGEFTGNLVVLILLILLILVFSIFGFPPCAREDHQLTCALVFLFSIMILWLAFLSRPDDDDNEDHGPTIGFILLSIFFLSLVLFGLGAGGSPTGKEENRIIHKPASALNEDEGKEEGGADAQEEPEEGKEKEVSQVPDVTLKTVLFHIIMCLACMYASMVLTRWGSPVINGHTTDFYVSSNWVCYIVKIITVFLSSLLFLATLLAMRCFGFSHRDEE